MVGRNRKFWTGRLSDVALCLVLATGLGACSTIDSWFGGDDGAPADTAAGPDLANLPAKAAVVPTDSSKLSDSLQADLQNAKHSAEVLRGGGDAPAPPPPETAPAAAAAAPAIAAAAKPADVATPAPAPKADESKDNSFTPPPQGKTIPGVLPDVSSIAKFGARYIVRPNHVGDAGLADAGYVETAELPSGTLPVTPAVREETRDSVSAPRPTVENPVSAVPPVQNSVKMPVSSRPIAQAAVMPSRTIDPADAALGFQPSSAPPLDSSITDFVPASIVQNYRNAAQQAGAVATVHHNATGGKARKPKTVVANLGGTITAAPSFDAGADVPADVVVFFADNCAQLDGKGARLVRKFAQAYRASESQGGVRVVGHASSRTKDMPVDKHLEFNRAISQKRATAVADVLTRAGVPADKILVEAASDSQPIYFESMPKGEDGNRRVEIFLQH